MSYISFLTDIYVPMYLDKIPNRNSNPTWLVRKSIRDGKRILKITIANVTHLPEPIREGLRILLRGGHAIKSFKDAFHIKSTKHHGHVAVVLHMMKHLKMTPLIAPKNSRFRRLVLGMIAARVIKPASKLQTRDMLDKTSCITTLNEELDLKYVDQNDLYEAMDELAACKTKIECRLAKRHLTEGGMVLYDVTSSYLEGDKNAFGAYGYNRDKKKGKKQIVYGLMTDKEGCPVSVEVFPGNTPDIKTLGAQISKLQNTFGLKHVILVGDRGLLKQKQIQEEIIPVGLDWITGMQKQEIREVVEQEKTQMSLFDKQDLVEIQSDVYPNERLVLCRNPLQAAKTKKTRDDLLAKADAKLDKILAATTSTPRRLKDKAKIGMRVERALGKHKLKKFYVLDIEEGYLSYTHNAEAIQKAERLDGIYAIRSSLKQPPEQLVSDYKRLSAVERAFRVMKSISLRVRPIYHVKPERVIAHVFLCMLAYYVEFHLRKKLAPMTFAEDDLEAKRAQRDNVVEPVKPSENAKKKAHNKKTDEDERPKNFESIMEDLSGICRLTGVLKITSDDDHRVKFVDEELTPTQSQALKLLNIKSLC